MVPFLSLRKFLLKLMGHLYSNYEVINFVRKKFVDNFCLPVGRDPDATLLTDHIDTPNEMVGQRGFFLMAEAISFMDSFSIMVNLWA